MKSGILRWTALAVIGAASPTAHGLDLDGNGFNDVWELVFESGSLPPDIDTDGDGASNRAESAAGTDPFQAQSVPRLGLELTIPTDLRLHWDGVAGKHYTLSTRTNLLTSPWTNLATFLPPRDASVWGLSLTNAPGGFYRLAIADVDSDQDGVTDYEEYALGFDPATSHSERRDATDLQRVTAGLTAANILTAAVLDPHFSEGWPEPALVAVRRTGGLGPLLVPLALTGTATVGVDYTATATTSVFLPAGARETWLEFRPLADADHTEPPESLIVTLLPGAGYTLGATNAVALTLLNEPTNSLPSAKAAARFLIQAAFGPDQDVSTDADDIPENVEALMQTGYAAWIDDQFTRPVGLLQPWVDWAVDEASALQLHGNWKEFAWWHRAMGDPKLRPDASTTQLPDPLRQRVAFALSEILVVSDRPEQLATEPRGIANYYDLMVHHAFGNFEDLLLAVALHPAMGIYLSHLGNRKADPVNRIYPDENFAREVMQLFSIGLWVLNPDGTRALDGDERPIPTYDNDDITELARVFTGLSFGNNDNFQLYPRDFTQPMKMWDAWHDCEPKVLLGGLALPARAPSAGNTGTAGMADVRAAVSNLFWHPNVGPFIGRQLIQRLVTSNPGTGYVARVAAAFADNGAGTRGDMQAVVRAILLDPDARDPAKLDDPTWGKLREPFLRVVNLARAFNASSTSGFYPLDQFVLDHLQDPMNAPSVFNYFLPTHSPPGPLMDAGLVAPEFQIVNASSAITGPNYFWNALAGGLHRWGAGNPDYAVRLNLTNELAMIVPADQIAANVPAGPPADPDPLLRRLDLVLTGGTLSPEQFQIVREAMERVAPPTWRWHHERLRLAIYLIVGSPEFNVLR